MIFFLIKSTSLFRNSMWTIEFSLCNEVGAETIVLIQTNAYVPLVICNDLHVKLDNLYLLRNLFDLY